MLKIISTTVICLYASSLYAYQLPGGGYNDSCKAALHASRYVEYGEEGHSWMDSRNSAEDARWYEEPSRYYDDSGRRK